MPHYAHSHVDVANKDSNTRKPAGAADYFSVPEGLLRSRARQTMVLPRKALSRSVLSRPPVLWHD